MLKRWQVVGVGLIGLAVVILGGSRLRAEVTLEIFRAQAEKVFIGLLPIQTQKVPPIRSARSSRR